MLLPGRSRVSILDAFFNVKRDPAAQRVRPLPQSLVELLQHRVPGRILLHQHRRTDLVQYRHRQRDPYCRAQQPDRDMRTQPQQHIIAPQHTCHAQCTPQQ